MLQINEITPYLYIPFVAWAIAQVIKFTLSIIKGDVNIRYLYASGGMPSVHSAVVCSLATWALIDGGVASPLFGITVVFAAIVMYDSFGVRRSAGDQARTLNKLINDLSSQGNLKNSNDYSRLREILGHKPLEVVVGAGLGVTIACVFGFSKILNDIPWLLRTPTALQSKWLLIFAGVVIVVSPFIVLLVMRRYKNTKKIRTNLLYLAYGSILFGLLLGISSFIAYEQLSSILSEWWFILIITSVWVIYSGVFKLRAWQNIKKAKPSADMARKSHWLSKAKKSKSKKKR